MADARVEAAEVYWPTVAQWDDWTREQRIEFVLTTIATAVRTENWSRARGMPTVVTQALILADLALVDDDDLHRPQPCPQCGGRGLHTEGCQALW